MADFTATVSVGAVLATWLDATTPTRINPLAGKPHLYWSIVNGTPAVRFSCTVGGVLEPLDAALGGRLFKWSWSETPAALAPIAIPTPAGQSSVALFGAALGVHVGHHLILCWREHGGSVAIPFIVEAP